MLKLCYFYQLFFHYASSKIPICAFASQFQRCQLAELTANFYKTSRMEGQKQKYFETSRIADISRMQKYSKN